MSLSTDTEELSVQQRVEVSNNVINFSGDVEPRDRSYFMEKERSAVEADLKLRSTITSARNELPRVKISAEQILYLCEEATRAGCDGQRGEIFATQIAKTCAALDGRVNVNAADLIAGVQLALVPRSKYFVEDFVSPGEVPGEIGPKDTGSLSPIVPPPRDGGTSSPETEIIPEDVEEQTMQDHENHGKEQNEKEEQQAEREEMMMIPKEFMFGVNMIPVPPSLLMFMGRTKKGRGGKRSKRYNLERGRSV